MKKKEKPYLSASAAARELDVAASTLIEWIDKGAFPGTKRFGRDFRVPREAVERAKREGVCIPETREAA